MAEDVASLGMRVDSQGINEGAAGLEKLAVAAERAEPAALGAASAANAMAESSRTLGSANSNAAASWLAISQSADQAARKVVQSSAAADTSARVQASLADSFKQLRAAQAGAASQTEGVGKAQGAAALTAKQYGQAMRLLPAQITDIVTGLVSGQPAYLVAIQQGGQLRDSFGSIGGTLKALASVITPTKLIIGGLAAAAVLLGKAYSDGSDEAYEFNKAIELTGNAAGTTTDQLSASARRIDAIVGTQHNAAKVLAQLVATGKVGAGQLESAAIAAIQLERNAGVAAEETVKNLAALGDHPKDAARQLNQQYHFLTASVYEQIAALEDEGHKAAAAAVAQQAFQQAVSDRAKKVGDNLGYLQKATRGVKDAAKEMWDSLLDVGREKSAEQKLTDKLKEIEGRLKGNIGQQGFAVDGGLGLDSGLSAGERAALEQQRKQLLDQQRQQRPAAKAGSRAASERAAQDATFRDIDVRRAAAVTAAEQAERNADERRKARLTGRIADLQRALSAELDVYKNQGDLLEAQHSAGLVSEADYYAQKRALIDKSTVAQAKALDDENRILAQGTAQARAAATEAKASADSMFGKGAATYAQALAEATRKGSEAQQVQLQNDEKIKANSAEKAKLAADEAAQLAVLTVQAKAYQDQLVRGYQAAQAAAKDFLDTQRQQFQRQLAGQGAGNQQREFDSGINSIEDRFQQQRQDVARDRINHPEVDPKIYEQQLALIRQTQDAALADYRVYWTKLKAGEQDWTKGASEALRNYADEARNTAKATETVFSNAFQGLEDSLTSGLTGNGFKVSKFIDQIIADITRLEVVKPLLGGLFDSLAPSGGGGGGGNFLSGIFGDIFGGGKAGGGDTKAGTLYRVNERGIEGLRIPGQADYLMMGNKNGEVIPNGALGGGGRSLVVNQTIHTSRNGRGTPAQQQIEAARQLRIATARFN